MLGIITVGLDKVKNVFQAHGADASGQAVLRKGFESYPQNSDIDVGYELLSADLRRRGGP